MNVCARERRACERTDNRSSQIAKLDFARNASVIDRDFLVPVADCLLRQCRNLEISRHLLGPHTKNDGTFRRVSWNEPINGGIERQLSAGNVRPDMDVIERRITAS